MIYAERNGVTFRTCRLLAPKWMPAAITISPRTVLVCEWYWNAVSDERREQLFTHETQHTKQAAHYGLLWLPAYLLSYVKYGYKNNPLEQDARRAAGE